MKKIRKCFSLVLGEWIPRIAFASLAAFLRAEFAHSALGWWLMVGLDVLSGLV